MDIIGNVLSRLAAGVDDEGLLEGLGKLLRSTTKSLQMSLQITQAEMDLYALTETEPYRKLVAHIDHELVLEQRKSATSLRRNITAVLDVMMCQSVCEDLITEARLRQAFGPYMKP